MKAVTKRFPDTRSAELCKNLQVLQHEVCELRINPLHLGIAYFDYTWGLLIAALRARSIRADMFIADSIEAGLVAMAVSSRLRIPFVFDFRDDYSLLASYDEWKLRHFLVKRLEQSIPRRAHMVTTANREISQFCIALGTPDSKVVVVPNGVDTSIYFPMNGDQSLRDELDLNKHSVVLYRGKITKYYRVETLMKAMAIVQREHGHVKFVVVGDGVEMDAMKRLAQSLGLGDAVIFTGFVSTSVLPKYINLADICLYPIPNSSGLAPLEYAACKKPSILPIGSTGKLGVSHELVEKNAVLAVDDSPEGFAGGILTLLHNRDRAQAMGERAMQIVRRSFQWSQVAAIYEQSLRRALSRNGSVGSTRNDAASCRFN